jgi:glycosyltransferase involved in cell wall biosynthesis
MACGLPVIGSAVGVNIEIIVDGVTGFLVKRSDAWLEALRTLLGDADMRKRMGMAGRSRVASEYTMQIQQAVLHELIYSVTTESKCAE